MNILKISICIMVIGFSVNSFAKTYSYSCTLKESVKKTDTYIQCQSSFRMKRYSHNDVRLYCTSTNYPCAFNVSKRPKSGLYCNRIYNVGPPNHITSSCHNRSRHTYHPAYTFTCVQWSAGEKCRYNKHRVSPPYHSHPVTVY